MSDCFKAEPGIVWPRTPFPTKVILSVVTDVNLDLAMQCFLNQAVRRINVIVVFLQNVLYII